MNNIIIVSRELFPCDACGKMVIADAQVEVSKVGELVDGKVPFEGKVIGTSIRHDCMKAQR